MIEKSFPNGLAVAEEVAEASKDAGAARFL
jgi:hypothetical protein